MGRLENYSKKSVKKIISEHGRTASNYKNHVDLKRSKLNWTYGAGDKSADEVLSIIESRCKEIMGDRKMQEQTNIMSDWVFTYPRELCERKVYDTGKVNSKTGKPVIRHYYAPKDPDHCRAWMSEVYAFCQDRYGAENVIAGYVHMDETTPHIDVNLVPEAVSRKTGKNTVSSASLFTRAELSQCQRDLERYMGQMFNQKGMILNGRTQGGYTTDELKKRNADRAVMKRKAKALQAQKEENDKRKEELDKKDANLAQSVEVYNNAVNEYNDAVSKLNEEREAVERDREALEREKREYKSEIRAAYENKFHEYMTGMRARYRNNGRVIPQWMFQIEDDYKKYNDEISL